MIGKWKPMRQLFRLGGALAISGMAAAAQQVAQPACAKPQPEALVLPSVGLGLWKAAPGEVAVAIKHALRSGYRLLDGAAAYANEAEVGAAISEAISEGIVRRDEVWVVSKLFNTHHCWHGDCSRPAIGLAKTLSDLGLDTIDLYLMHWPVAIEQLDLKPLGGLRLKDGTPNPKLNIEMEYLETWGEMIRLKQQGQVKHIGVCNFNLEQLQALLAAYPDDKPEVNQVELHPFLAQPELVGFCREHGIALMAYSPLGSADSYSGASFPKRGAGSFETPHGGAPLLQNELVHEIAARHGCTPAQVLIAWSVAQGFTCLPKSVKPDRIAQNLASPGACPLTAADLAQLKALDCGFRYGIGYLPGYFDCPNAPWFGK